MCSQVFTGVCTALVTPFSEDGSVSIPMLQRLLDRQLEAGVTAFVICGTTGEAPTLSDPEKLLLFREAKKWVGSRGTVIAGTGSNCTEHAAALSRAAQDQGADALLVVTPYYNKATPQGLLRHYGAISEAVEIPILLYNVPTRTGVDIPVSTYSLLSQLPHIAGVKEASSDLHKLALIRKHCSEDFRLWSGNDNLLLPVWSLGGSGVISVVSNLCPGAMKAVTDALEKDRWADARQNFLSLLPLMDALFSEVNPIPVKAAMKLLNLDCGPCRLPLTALSQAHLESIDKLLKDTVTQNS